MGSSLKLGTRRSLLAWAQSGWVARELERLNPGLRVQLEGIDTRGDKILDVPLQSIEGKEFFVAELDDALKSGAVDLTVHSMKDLSLERPREFVCAAVPRRENSRDVILFGPGADAKLKSGQTLRIGTSSPRRLENIPPFLAHALPMYDGKRSSVELVEIRGNVNTRLGRVHEATDSPRYLDGVVLAFAGLIRLWADAEARLQASALLKNTRWMVLPLRECPTAPGQGALAVECRSGDARVREALAKLHDEATALDTAMERELLAEWGGGCHQRFGATRISHPDLGHMLFVRGVKPDSTFVDEFHWNAPSPPPAGSVGWHEGTTHGPYAPLSASAPARGAAVFVAHSRALPMDWELKDARVWTSGVASWFRLAKRGIWVEGCAEGLGFDAVSSTLREGVLQLPSLLEWVVLTHEGATSEWKDRDMTAIATYRTPGPLTQTPDFEGATHFYWTSGSQFERYAGDALRSPSSKIQNACGPGKTARHLMRLGVKPVIFPSIEEWKKWLKTSKNT